MTPPIEGRHHLAIANQERCPWVHDPYNLEERKQSDFNEAMKPIVNRMKEVWNVLGLTSNVSSVLNNGEFLLHARKIKTVGLQMKQDQTAEGRKAREEEGKAFVTQVYDQHGVVAADMLWGFLQFSQGNREKKTFCLNTADAITEMRNYGRSERFTAAENRYLEALQNGHIGEKTFGTRLFTLRIQMQKAFCESEALSVLQKSQEVLDTAIICELDNEIIWNLHKGICQNYANKFLQSPLNVPQKPRRGTVRKAHK